MLKVIKFPFRKFSSLLGLSLIVITLFFYKPIYADQLPQSEIVGVSWNLIDTEISLSSGGNWYTYTYELEVKLKNKYVGVVNGTLSYSYSDVQSSSSTPTQKTSTTTKTNYVNGDSFKFNVYISNIGSQFTGNGPMFNCSYLINNSTTNVTKYEDLNSIESVVNVLNDIYSDTTNIEGLSTNQLVELEKIVSNTSLANEYLDSISKLRQWNIPFESLSFNLYQFQNNREIYDVGIDNLNYNNYPIFNIPKNTIIYTFWGVLPSSTAIRSSYTFIFLVRNNIQSRNDLNNKLLISDGIIDKYENLSQFYDGSSWWSLIKITINNFTTNSMKDLEWVGNNTKMIFIYSNYSSYSYLNTDFALTYGLSNNLLDDLHIIANGTNQSNNSASGTENTNNTLVESQNELFSQEDNFNENMNDSLDQIDTNFSFDSKFGSSFIRSSEWVKTQFDRMTGSTPFGSILGFSLLLGVGLLLIGKVLG